LQCVCCHHYARAQHDCASTCNLLLFPAGVEAWVGAHVATETMPEYDNGVARAALVMNNGRVPDAAAIEVSHQGYSSTASASTVVLVVHTAIRHAMPGDHFHHQRSITVGPPALRGMRSLACVSSLACRGSVLLHVLSC
jgi:hypothetical protein